MKSKETVVVLGRMGQAPFGGMAWQILHYLEGCRRLGYDAWYVEDTGEWPYDPRQNAITACGDFTVEYLSTILDRFGFGSRWAYRNAGEEGRVYGVTAQRLKQLWKTADLLINVTGGTVLRDEHLMVPTRLYLETDPVLPQIEVAQGRAFTVELLSTHTHWATFGENLTAPDCGVPVGRFPYVPTRQPVIVDWWPGGKSPTRGFTTVANWRQTGKDVYWQGEWYRWSKHHEFVRFIELPSRTDFHLELALACYGEEDLARLRLHGWTVTEALEISGNLDRYRQYISDSAGEFTVAKDQNVRLRSGWFSDRSACYLAAGRPVVTQDTGFPNILPCGMGLFAFRTLEDVLDAFDSISSHPKAHAAAAQELAHEYFSADRVLRPLLDCLGT